MRTEALVELLAHGPVRVDLRTPERRLAVAAAAGLGIAASSVLAGLGVRADLSAAIALPMFWIKIAFALAIAGAAFVAACRLARPADRAGASGRAIGAVLALLWVAAIAILLDASVAEWRGLVMGATAAPCVASIAALALPALAATLLALSTLAPTRPRAAGLAAGLLAGGVAAAAYAWHCDEMALPFVAVWYVLGIAIPASLGALVAPAVLRWR